MPPNRTKRVNVPLTASEKEQWDDVTGDGKRFSSLAELARTSVYRELEDYHNADTGDDESRNEALVDSIEEMSGVLNHLDSTVSDIDTRLGRVEETVSAESPEMDLENVIYDLLPVQPEQGEGPTAAELAEQYGFDHDETVEALDRLDSQTSTVVSDQPPKEVVGIPKDSDTTPPIYYYRTEGSGQ